MMMSNTVKIKGIDMLSLKKAIKQKPIRENYEGYEDDDEDDNDGMVMGVTIAVFVVLILLNIALWIFALWYLLKHKNDIPSWALIVGILGLFGVAIPGGPLATILVVYVSK